MIPLYSVHRLFDHFGPHKSDNNNQKIISADILSVMCRD